MSPPSSPLSGDRGNQVRFRRALTLLLITLVVPGSAQLVAGNKKVGRIAVRIWLGVVAAAVLVALVALVWPGFVYWLATNTLLLGFLRLVLLVLAIGWAGLFLDAWRLGRPLQLLRKHRLVMVSLSLAMCLVVAGSLTFSSHVVSVQRDFIGTVFDQDLGKGLRVEEAQEGRYNVLLLGGDSGKSRVGLRPDSITVASVDGETGRTVLFGLPRNLQDFPFREGSVMDRQFPDGFDCDGCYLNGLSTWASDHPELFEGHDNPGVEATIQAVEGITGLTMNYYVMINMQGFRSLVDAVGGVEVNVRDPIPVGGLGEDVTGYIEPGVQRLDGHDALWFARSREGADDYARMARQKCLMGAMLKQLSPGVVVRNFADIAAAGEEMVATNVPASELDRFVDLALKARSQPLATVSFVPPQFDTANPDIQRIRAMVKKAVARSEGAGESGEPAETTEPGQDGTPTPRRQEQEATTAGSIGSLSEGYAANQAEDLSAAC